PTLDSDGAPFARPPHPHTQGDDESQDDEYLSLRKSNDARTARPPLLKSPQGEQNDPDARYRGTHQPHRIAPQSAFRIRFTPASLPNSQDALARGRSRPAPCSRII